MTCIVGIVDNGMVYIGGDSAGSDGYNVTIRKDDKVFVKEDMAFGFTDSFRMGQILKYDFDIPFTKASQDPMEYMVKTFIPGLRTCLSSGGFAKKDNNVEKGGEFFVGYKSRLFRIQSDFQVGESHDKFDAIGSGAEIARGALYATQTLPTSQRIELALEAATRYNAFVRPPYYQVIGKGDPKLAT